MNNKLPWYIWFSFFSLALLWGDTSRRIKINKNNTFDSISLWNRAVGNIAKLCGLYMFLPLLLFSIIANIFFRNIPPESIFFPIIISFLLLLIYILGVIAAYKHILWRLKNITHLL